jgi:hypothetical protein
MSDPSGNNANSGSGQNSTRFGGLFLAVIASLIASILYSLFYTPVLNGVNYITTQVISPFYSGYLNIPYAQAALGPTNASLYVILQVLLQFIFFASAIMVMAYYLLCKYAISKIRINRGERQENIPTNRISQMLLHKPPIPLVRLTGILGAFSAVVFI